MASVHGEPERLDDDRTALGDADGHASTAQGVQFDHRRVRRGLRPPAPALRDAKALEASEAVTRALLASFERHAGGAGWVFWGDSGKVSATTGMLTLLGMTASPVGPQRVRDDRIGQAFEVSELVDCIAPSDRSRLLARLRRTLRTGAPSYADLSLTTERGGRRLHLAAEPGPIGAGAALVGVAIDVSAGAGWPSGMAEVARAAGLGLDAAGPLSAGLLPSPAATPGAPGGSAIAPPAGVDGPVIVLSDFEIDAIAQAAAHELQAPLRKIVFYADLVKNHYSTSHPAAAMDARSIAVREAHVDTILRSAAQMQTRIAGLARYAEAASAPLAKEDVRLSQLIDSATATLTTEFDSVGSQVRTVADGVFHADRGLMTGALTDLLRDALRRSEADDPTIAVSLETLPQAAGSPDWRITVARQSNDRDSLRHGSTGADFCLSSADHGIELATCASVARRHGGRVWLAGAPSAPTAYHFDLAGAERSAPSHSGEAARDRL